MSRLCKCMFLFSVIFTSGSLYGQQTAAGRSMPGTIGKKEAENLPPKHVIQCRVQLIDESGDGILTEGEKASLLILVANDSDSLTIKPKLQLFSFTREHSSPVCRIFLTGELKPADSFVVKDDINWQGTLPTGELPCHLIVSDLNRTAKPLALDFFIETLGSGSVPLSPPRLD